MAGGKRYFEFGTGSGGVLIESGTQIQGMGPISTNGTIQKTGDAFEAALARLEGVIGPLERQVRDRLEDAKEVSVEFGIKLAGKAGLVIAESEFEGNFKVTIKWVKP
jgi:hypothetical protein